MIDHLDSWARVNAFHTRFAHCDDGDIAEGVSEGIARLLVDRWCTLPQLVALIRRNPRLKAFVLGHIDSTLDTGDLDRIARLSAASCPADAESLCKALAMAASRAAQ